MMKEVIRKVMLEYGWGIYLKSEPITRVPVLDKSPVFEITDIDIESFLEALDKRLSDDIQG
jgi:hypothetical protein